METPNFNSTAYGTQDATNQWNTYNNYNQTPGYDASASAETVATPTFDGQMGQTAMDTYNNYAEPTVTATETATETVTTAETETPSSADEAVLMQQLENLGNTTEAATTANAQPVASTETTETVMETPVENTVASTPVAETTPEVTNPETTTTSTDTATEAPDTTKSEESATEISETKSDTTESPETTTTTPEATVTPEQRQKEITSATEKLTELAEAIENAATSEAAVFANTELAVYLDFYGELSQPDNLRPANTILDNLEQKYNRIAKIYQENGRHTDAESFYAQAAKAGRIKDTLSTTETIAA